MLLLAPALAAPPSWPDLDTPPPGDADLKGGVALVIAVEDYAFLPDIPGARANGEAWEAYLRSRGATVKSMYDGEAVREEIDDGVRALATLRKKGTPAWVVFVGHGAPGRSSSGSLVAYDAQRTARSIDANSVAIDELSAALASSEGPAPVVLVDACFSGRANGDDELATDGTMPARAVAIAPADRALVAVAAGADEYAGPLLGLDRPAFSWLVLGALRGWGDADGNGGVTAAEAVAFARARLVELVDSRRQTPAVYGDSSVTLGSGREAAPDLVALVAAAKREARQNQAAPAASTGQRFDDVKLDVSDALALQRCDDEARAQGRAERDALLAQAAATAASEAQAAWLKLGPEAETCATLTDRATRDRCADTVAAFVARAKSASVELPAATHVATTDCGQRSFAFEAERRAVKVSSLDAAVKLEAKLRAVPKTEGAPSEGTALSGSFVQGQAVELVSFLPGGKVGLVSTRAGVFRTNDGGSTWVNAGWTGSRPSGIALLPAGEATTGAVAVLWIPGEGLRLRADGDRKWAKESVVQTHISGSKDGPDNCKQALDERADVTMTGAGGAVLLRERSADDREWWARGGVGRKGAYFYVGDIYGEAQCTDGRNISIVGHYFGSKGSRSKEHQAVAGYAGLWIHAKVEKAAEKANIDVSRSWQVNRDAWLVLSRDREFWVLNKKEMARTGPLPASTYDLHYDAATGFLYVATDNGVLVTRDFGESFVPLYPP